MQAFSYSYRFLQVLPVTYAHAYKKHNRRCSRISQLSIIPNNKSTQRMMDSIRRHLHLIQPIVI